MVQARGTAFFRMAALIVVMSWLLGESLAYASESQRFEAPWGLRWGTSPEEVHKLLGPRHKFVGPPASSADRDKFLFEMRYTGAYLDLSSDHIAPLFWVGNLFALAISYSPTAKNPASRIWETLVNRLTQLYGPPHSRTKPPALISLEAMGGVKPVDGPMQKLYAMAQADKENGRYLLWDLQIQTGSWVPEAVWYFKDSITVKSVMRAGPSANAKVKVLKPAVLITDHAIMGGKGPYP